MKKRSKIAAGAGAALAVVGAGGAVAADRLTPKAESQAIVNDAAKQLGVDPAKLSDALEQALKNRIDAAVKDGRLTKEQGDAMKRRITSAAFPLFIGPGFERGGRPASRLRPSLGPPPRCCRILSRPQRMRSSVRRSRAASRSRRSPRTRASRSTSSSTRSSPRRRSGSTRRSTDGRLTKAERDMIVAGLKEQTTAIVNGTGRPDGFGFRGHHGHGFFPGGPREDG